MEEFDLKSLWKQGEQQAEQYYQEIEPKVLNLAQRQSQGILAVLKRKMQIEFLISPLAYIVMVFLFWDKSLIASGLLIALYLVTSLYNLRLYKHLHREIGIVNTTKTVESIQRYIQLLKDYAQRMRFYLNVYTPFGTAIGVIVAYEGTGQNWNDLLDYKILLPQLGFVALVVLAAFWLNKTYVNWLFGSKIKEMQHIYDGLGKD